MAAPVMDLDDFFDVYRGLLKAGDTAGLGLLYTADAVLSSRAGPFGGSWVLGRDAIVANLASALRFATILGETPSSAPWQRGGTTLAARVGTFTSTARLKIGFPTLVLTVRAAEVLNFDETAGWRYVSDQSEIVSIARA